MLRPALLTITLALSLSACDESVPLAAADDVSLRPAWGIKYDTNHLGDSSSFEEVSMNGSRFDKIKVKGPYAFTLIGEKEHAYATLGDFLGAKIRIQAKFKDQSMVADAEVIDIVKTVPTALILEIPDPALEICDIVDGVLILASAGECPD